MSELVGKSPRPNRGNRRELSYLTDSAQVAEVFVPSHRQTVRSLPRLSLLGIRQIVYWEDQEMSTAANWIPVLTLIAATAWSTDEKALGQAPAERLSGLAQSEQLPPPERPTASADGPALTDPSRVERSIRTGRPYLGITFDTRYPDAAIADSIVPGSPAEQAGIEPGDTIEAINDYEVSSYRDAFAIVSVLRPGEIIDIDFSRRVSGRTQAVLGDEPAADRTAPDYADETTEAPSLELDAPEGMDERLPEPTYDLDFRRSDELQFNSSSPDMRRDNNGADSRDYNGAGGRAYDDDSNRQGDSSRRLDAPPARRPNERPRAGERGIRRRPLLPWRRNALMSENE
jgi:hypothetical protein